MFNELALQIEKHLASGNDFAIAQVVDRIAPSSGKVGDKALILNTGELIGWIGGGCVRGIVIKEALEVIRSRRYRRVRISPEGGTRETPNFKEYVMSCQSKGTVEVLIEPVVSQPEIIIVGKSEIARKLAALAGVAGFRVSAMAPGADPHLFPQATQVLDTIDFSSYAGIANACIIVSTQGEEDDLAVKKALETRARYVGFVASKSKAVDIRAFLEREGLSEARIHDLRSPVGLDLNAKLASEVAVSILAEVIAFFRKGGQPRMAIQDTEPAAETAPDTSADAKFQEEFYINPVCQVPVSRKTPKHVLEYKGEQVYFCCDGCKVAFEKNPAQYLPDL